MARYGDVSISVIKRMPRYYRFLGNLMEKGVHRISSRELAHIMNLTASQIRQDLNCFGGFGQQGYGYNVDALHHEIGKILGLRSEYRTILIGAGNLGKTIAQQIPFEHSGFSLIGVFDLKEDIVGSTIRGLEVQPISELESFCRKKRPVAAVLCIPREAAQELADKLVELGIKGFWNFSHYDLSVEYANVALENVHLVDSLMTLCYKLSEIVE